MCDLLKTRLAYAAGCQHIWWGVSVENRKYGLPRIEHLRAARPRVAFLSIEPLLEDIGQLDLSNIHWVIVGGESGPGARPMEREWVVSIRNQCRRAKVPFFFKQWGGVQKSKHGRELDGRTHDGIPINIRPEIGPDRDTRYEISRAFEQMLKHRRVA
jgi:protein gp37